MLIDIDCGSNLSSNKSFEEAADGEAGRFDGCRCGTNKTDEEAADGEAGRFDGCRYT